MRVTHRHVAAGTNDPTKEVSRDRWNAGHRVLLAPAATSPEEIDQVLLRYATATTIEIIFRDAGGIDRIVPFSSGGGVPDGDKGDITVTGGTWTIDDGAVTDQKIVSLGWGKLTGLPASFPPSAHGHAAGDISGLATVATSGSASDLGAGTLPAARFNDTAHGSRAGGTLHADATTTVSGFMSAADKTKVNGVATGATANATDAALRDRSTHTGTQLASTISNFAATVIATVLTGFAVAGTRTAVVATDSILAAFGKVQKYLNDLSALAFSGSAADLSGSKTAAFISDFSEAVDDRVAALAVAGTNMTITYDDVANTLTFASTGGGGGGSPGGANNKMQFNNAGAFGGAGDVENEGGQLRLLAIASPAVPATGGLKLFARNDGNAPLPAYVGPLDVAATSLQASLADGNVSWWLPATGTGVSVLGWPAATAGGTATAAAVLNATRRARLKRIEYLVTAASATAIAFWRVNSALYTINGGNAWEGGFRATMHAGPSTGVTNASHRFFMGLWQAATPTDVNPSTLLLTAGIGYDAADTEVQFMTNDGTGAATKVSLGAAFPKPNADRAFTYRLRLYAPPGTTRRLFYEVTYLETGAVATGSVTTDLPATSDFLAPVVYASVGGVSNVVGVAVGSMFFQTEQS